MNKSIKALLLLSLSAMIVSCVSPKSIRYISDAESTKSFQVNVDPIRIQPYDKLSVIIGTRSAEITNTVNLPTYSQRIGYSSAAMSNGLVSSYTVDSKGYIDMPEVGQVKVAGMTREEVAEQVRKAYTSKGILSDMTVSVEFLDMFVSVGGEVAHPGRYAIVKDKTTLLDALSMAGDLTITGRRESVAVIRQEEGKEVVYRVNLCSADSLFSSPAFRIQQNDYVYVEPNNMRVRQSTVNGNNVLSTSFWLSLASLLVTIAVLIKK